MKLAIWTRLRVLLLGVCLLTPLAPVELQAAETKWVQLELNDGTKITAPYVKSDRHSITVYQNGAEKSIPMESVVNFDMLDKPPAQAPTQPAPTPADPVAPVTPATPVTPVNPVTPATPVTPPTAGSTGAEKIEVQLPSLVVDKPVSVVMPLQWTTGGEAPWYKTNRASSLHRMPNWQRASAAREKAILEQIAALADGMTATDAHQKLAAAGNEAVPYLVIFLMDSNPIRARHCAEILIARGNADVTKYLIEALYATTDENNRVLLPWMYPYARTLVAGCNKFTQAGSTVDPAQPGFSATEFIAVWNRSLIDNPAQFGEPVYQPAVLPPNAKEQEAAWAAFFRGLALKRVQFVEPPPEDPDLTRKYPRSKDANVDAAILRDIEQLATGDEEAKEAAKADLLRRDWNTVAPYLAQALLEKEDIPTRMILLDIFGRKGDNRATWHTLQTLLATWGSPTRVPTPNHAAVIRILDGQLRKLTGLGTQPAIQPTFVGGYRSVQGFVDHWNKHFAEYPPQFGEPELDKKLPKYNEYIRELRFIGEDAKE